MAGNTVYVQGSYVDVHDNEVVNLSIDKATVQMQDEVKPSEVARPEVLSEKEMKRAVENSASKGYWWSSRSWAVVYRVYQMKGYMASISQFVREVQDWEVQTGFECNYFAVQKPISSGMLSGLPDKWVKQGAQGQAVKLANTLLEELGNISCDSK